MKFISPKTDFAFKKIFGSEQSHDVLISFLNAMIYNGDRRISQLEILNPYLTPRIRGVKDTYLDVKAKLDNGTSVIIEMQVLNIEGFEKRILYNAAKAYSIQLGIGQSYSLLNPVIALTITDFVMFPEINQLTSRFILKEKDFLIDYPIYDLELVFVELPKFDKTLIELETLADKWLYFLKHAIDLDVVPESMNLVPEIKLAFEFAREGNLSPEELDELEHQEFFIQDQHNAIIKALKQGKTEAKLEMAAKLLDLLDDAAISHATGLSLPEIAKLRSTRSQNQ
ncbi:Rpn family recombination-promoting nuclease/putative transposase [Pseudanabaena galeata UHCC 0370]|uniref:Rpn family recombination-promoting nuclease/putative transposase n=1 Tax=Pseudanabaena galeata UHCC 0370 TaxID=3110310 RepID=A0ABU5TGI7_9CYAN|nr:Rpn family recombination-promoting nuclease/putative transposase [Pseudanabaena galeata]MEA5477259.1 Rpn family recombination-promoting nuclease/putative transposase [Pseudanabaena galeata UHCC 0370]